MSSEFVFPPLKVITGPAKRIEHIAKRLFWPSYFTACCVLALSMLFFWPVYLIYYGAQLCVQAMYLFQPQRFEKLACDQPIYTTLGLINDVSWICLHWPLVARWVMYQLIPCASYYGELWSEYSLTPSNVWSVIQLIGWSLTGPFGAVFGYIYELHRSHEWYTVYKGSRYLQETKETTLYINGICTTQGMLIRNCQKLEHQLNRRVIGIHNPSYGIISDLIECIVQRNLGLETSIVTATETIIMNELKKGHKVELIGHSQGGIIASLAVFGVAVNYSQWCREHPGAEPLSRLLTVVTYASAAKSFPDCGIRRPNCVDIDQLPQRNITHFVNYASTDMQTKWMSRFTHYAGDLVALNAAHYRVNRPVHSIDRSLNLGVYGRVLVSKEDQAGHWLGAFYKVDNDPYRNYIPISDATPQWRWFW